MRLGIGEECLEVVSFETHLFSCFSTFSEWTFAMCVKAGLVSIAMINAMKKICNAAAKFFTLA